MEDNELDFLEKELEENFSSVLDMSRNLDVRSIDFLIELINMEIDKNTYDLTLSADVRNITLLQGKIKGQRELIKILGNIKNIKNQL